MPTYADPASHTTELRFAGQELGALGFSNEVSYVASSMKDPRNFNNDDNHDDKEFDNHDDEKPDSHGDDESDNESNDESDDDEEKWLPRCTPSPSHTHPVRPTQQRQVLLSDREGNQVESVERRLFDVYRKEYHRKLATAKLAYQRYLFIQRYINQAKILRTAVAFFCLI